MTNPTGTSTDHLRRIPGLFRKWELPDIFETRRNYQIEEAGEHADGTPLFALFVSSLPIQEPEAGVADEAGHGANRTVQHDGLRGIRISVRLDEPEHSA